MKGVYIFLADGFEDIEALGTCDVLRRGGVRVQLTAIGDEPMACSSHGVAVGVDTFLDDLDCTHDGTGSSDVLIFPGGMPGTRNLASCRKLMELMQMHYDAGGTLAAICAAPGLVLGQLKDLEGVEFTCFDGFQELPESKGARFIPAPAVRCGRIITGRSAAHAVSFGLEILKLVGGEEKAEEVRRSMYLETI